MVVVRIKWAYLHIYREGDKYTYTVLRRIPGMVSNQLISVAILFLLASSLLHPLPPSPLPHQDYGNTCPCSPKGPLPDFCPHQANETVVAKVRSDLFVAKP